jgi:oligosaccharide repeat unit polymerase
MILSGKSILFFVLFALTFYSSRKGRDLFSPVRLYLLTFSLTIGITCLEISPFSMGWNRITWYILFISGSTYILGAISIWLISLSRGNRYNNLSDIIKILKSSTTNLHLNRFIIGICICLTGYIIVFLWGSYSVGAIPVFAINPDQARIDFAFFGSAANFIALVEPVFLLSACIFMSGFNKLRILFLIVSMFSILSSTMLLSRYLIIKLLFITLILYRYFIGPIKLKLVFLSFILFLVIIICAFILRSNGDFLEKKEYEQFIELRVKKGYEIIALPYAYIANNYWNLNYGIEQALDGKFNHTYGLRTFHAIFQIFKQSKNIENALDIESFLDLEVQKVPPFNTITYHWNLWRDFGFLGVILGSFLMGLIMAFLYSQLRTAPSWWNLLLYGNFAFFISLSFFASPWYHLPTWITIFSIYFILYFSFPKKQGFDS